MIDRWATPIWRSPDGTVEALERVPVGQAPFAESGLRDLLAARAVALPVRHFDPVFASPSVWEPSSLCRVWDASMRSF